MKKNLAPLFLLLFPFVFAGGDLDAQLARGLCWEISHPDLPGSSYLYGTMHVGDKRAHKFKKSALAAFKGADAYAMELDPGAVDPMDVLAMMKQPEGKTLEDMFTPEEWEQLDAYFLDKYKTSIKTFNEFKPFYVQTIMLQSSLKNQAGQAVDMYFYNEAKAANKDVFGLETVEEQMNAIFSMSEDEQKQMLLDGMEEEVDPEDAIDAMLKIYKKGDLNKLQEFSEQEDNDYGETFDEEVILKRNHTMAERLVPLIKEQTVFIGVGALHLPGEEGIINLLRKQGYTVEVVK